MDNFKSISCRKSHFFYTFISIIEINDFRRQFFRQSLNAVENSYFLLSKKSKMIIIQGFKFKQNFNSPFDNRFFILSTKKILMNCKLCLEPYRLDDSRKLPRVLTQCGHTFCNQCIRLNMIHSKQFICTQCNKVNFLLRDGNFPLNQTLISILENSQNGLCQFIKETEICKKHGKKLEAYCQNDKLLLCLTCILTQHKSHKIISIPQKVRNQKQSLRNCQAQLQKSREILFRKEEQCKSLVDRLNLDFNQYVFEINLMCKSILNQLKESEQNFISNAKKNIDKSVNEVQKVQTLVKEKIDFYLELTNICNDLNFKSGVQFIKESNKQIFVLENSKLKNNFSLTYKKEEIQKQKILNQVIKSLQQFVIFERKKANLQNDKKLPQSTKNDIQNQNNLLQKNLQKTSKQNSKEDIVSKIMNQSPCRLQKKSINSVHRGNKQPQILQVNLLQKYQKHLQAKNIKKRNSESLLSKGKSPKIQYQVKRSIQVSQKLFNKNLVQSQNGGLEGSAQKIKLVTCSIVSSTKKGSKLQNSITHSQFHSNKTDDFSLQFLNQSHIVASPESLRNLNQTFDPQTPVSIHSFMESSQFTVFQQKKDYTILKNSASFTIFGTEQKVFHFGGLKNKSISCQKVSNNISQLSLADIKVTGSLEKSKAQCVVLKSFYPKKCLILGGKDQNGERSSQIFSYDLEQKKLQKCQFQLNEPVSGFGAVVLNEKLYVFGGSSFSALKNLHEYKLGANSFEIKKLSSMMNSRDELGFAIGFDQYLYVAGGINSSNLVLNCCQRYCFKANKWYSIAAMKNPRRSFALVSLPNGLYAIGGHNGKSYLKTVEIYDFELQTWLEVTPMNQARFTHSAVSTSDYQNIIVFGGFENKPLKSVEVYNVVENKWRVINQMEEERFLHCSILIQQ